MSGFYTKYPVASKVLRKLFIKSYSKSAQTSSQAVAVTKKAVKGKRAACDGSGSKSADASASHDFEDSYAKFKKFGDKCDMFDIHKGNSKRYRILSYCMMPIIVIMAFNMLSHHEEPETHYVPYDHMYIRTKKFYFGDHRKTFFHGPNNFIPEDEEGNYKKLPDPDEEDLKRRKALRDLHAKEELVRRKQRREKEALK